MQPCTVVVTFSSNSELGANNLYGGQNWPHQVQPCFEVLQDRELIIGCGNNYSLLVCTSGLVSYITRFVLKECKNLQPPLVVVGHVWCCENYSASEMYPHLLDVSQGKSQSTEFRVYHCIKCCVNTSDVLCCSSNFGFISVYGLSGSKI